MPYIETHNQIPGIRGLMQFRPETALALNQLAQVLLANDNSFSNVRAGVIATFVSSQNDCQFCMSSHGAIAAHLPGCSHTIWRLCGMITKQRRYLLEIKMLSQYCRQSPRGGGKCTKQIFLQQGNKNK